MINSVTLLGRLTAAPELKQTGSGKSVTSFSIAVDKYRKEDGADFFTIVCWGGTAEFVCRYFQKGDPIAVQGRLENRSWQAGSEKRTVTEIIAGEVSFCGSKRTESKAEEDDGIAVLPY